MIHKRIKLQMKAWYKNSDDWKQAVDCIAIKPATKTNAGQKILFSSLEELGI